MNCFLLFENILDHILRQNTFDNTLKSFYNYRNYKIIKKNVFLKEAFV